MNSLKKTTLLLVLVITSITHAQWYGSKKVKGNGNMTTITRTTESYDAIKCAGSLDYILVKGSEGKLTIEGEENLLEYIVTKVKGDKLIVKVEDDGSVSGSGDLTIKGSTNNLEASVAGSGDFHGFNLEANNTTVSVAGSGDAEVVSNEVLKARVAGSGDIEYRGNPKKEDTKVSGSGSISN